MSLSSAWAWLLWKKIVESRLFQPKSDLLAGLFDFTNGSPINEDHLDVRPSKLFSDPTQFPSEPQSKAAYRFSGWLSRISPQRDYHTSSRRSAGGSLTSGSASPDTKEATCSLGLKTGHCQWRTGRPASFSPSFRLFLWIWWSHKKLPPVWILLTKCCCFFALRRKKAKGSTPIEQCECKPLIAAHDCILVKLFGLFFATNIVF